MISDHTNIDLLLQKSKILYTRRKLDKALLLAKEALDKSNEKTYTVGMVNSNLLLGLIHITSGRYQGDNNRFPIALEHIEAAEVLNEPLNGNGKDVDIFLALGEVYDNQKNFETAAQFCHKALLEAQEKDDLKNTILSLCSLSHLQVRQNNFEEALNFGNEALAQLNASPILQKDKHLQIEVYHQLAQVYTKKQAYAKILEFSQPVLEISQEIGDIEKEITALNNIAIFYGVESDYKTAMQYFLDALDKSKAINFRQNVAQCLINIGTIYASLYNYQESIYRYETVLKEYEDVLAVNTQIIINNNLGHIHYQLDEQENAEGYFEKALGLARENNYREMIAHSLSQLSRTNTARKKLDKALDNANQAQELFATLGDINGKQINLLNLGTIQFYLGNLDEAIKLTSQGIVTAKRMRDDTTEIKGYQLLANIYQKTKNYEKALDYQMVYSKAQENFAKEQRNRQIVDLEIQNAIKEKQKEIEQLTKENQYQSLLLSQSDQIAKQNAQLIAANEELRQFAYVASHDLKEPLRMIGSYTQLIHRLHANEFNEDSKVYFDFVSEGVNRMNNLLDALLKYATIGKSDEDLEEVNLSDVIEMAVINLRVRIEETNAVINAATLPTVFSIQSLLLQLLQNLISNAIKFHKPNQDPEINIFFKESKKEIIIYVADNGIGIKAEYKDRIFIIFQRLHTRTEYEGTGIGLAICYKIMQRLGGRIWVESNDDGGATFCVAIPKEEED